MDKFNFSYSYFNGWFFDLFPKFFIILVFIDQKLYIGHFIYFILLLLPKIYKDKFSIPHKYTKCLR